MDLFACHKYLRQELLLYIFPNELGNISNSLWSTIKWWLIKLGQYDQTQKERRSRGEAEMVLPPPGGSAGLHEYHHVYKDAPERFAFDELHSHLVQGGSWRWSFSNLATADP